MPPTVWTELDTPALRIDLDRLERNLEDMAAVAKAHGVQMRPHTKTHKMAEIGKRQMALGAIGLTVAKLGEAEAFAAQGLKDIFICYPLIGTTKLKRLRDLSREANLMTIVESPEGARGLSEAMAAEGRPLDVLIKVDLGMHRVGVPEERVPELAALVAGLAGLRLRGLCIHEGAVYGELDPGRRAGVARDQATRLVALARELRGRGHDIDIVSTGSTPGAGPASEVDGVTEIRPGNYAFYDAMQVGLGVTDLDHCALRIVSTVVSHSAPDRAIIDAGSKSLTTDLGPHGMNITRGYGIVVGHPGITIETLSEEHGWLRLAGGEEISIGEQLEVVPNHACAVANLFDWAAVTKGDQVVARWTVDGRGRVR